MIAARMRSGSSWADVCIRNVSSRGLLLSAKSLPPPGTYVEIRRGTVSIIGRTVWSKGAYFGVRAQDKIDINGLVREPRLNGRPPSAETTDGVSDRRADNRMPSPVSVEERLERSRRISSAFEFGLLILVAVTVAGIAATQVYAVLAKPFEIVASKL